MKTDTKISGSGKIGQGEYNLIKISGSGAIEGPVTFETFKVSGSCKVCPDATLEGNEMHISGSIHSQSGIKVNTLHVSGSLHSENDMKVRSLKASGSCHLQGKIYADEIYVSGSLKSSEEVNADIVEIRGMATLNDLFGEQITFIPENCNSFNFFRFAKHRKLSNVKNIECTTLEAGCLQCDTISAENILLTDGCVVNHIQCDGTLSYDSTCQIGTVEGNCAQKLLS